jgi:hypothetical protein
LHENNENYTIINATFLCIKGNSCNLDLSKVTTSNNKSYYSFLILGWGLISDIDILSESTFSILIVYQNFNLNQ